MIKSLSIVSVFNEEKVRKTFSHIEDFLKKRKIKTLEFILLMMVVLINQKNTT